MDSEGVAGGCDWVLEPRKHDSDSAAVLSSVGLVQGREVEGGENFLQLLFATKPLVSDGGARQVEASADVAGEGVSSPYSRASLATGLNGCSDWKKKERKKPVKLMNPVSSSLLGVYVAEFQAQLCGVSDKI